MTIPDELPLFADARASKEAGRVALNRASARHAAEIEVLVPLAVELARRAGPAGITIADVRLLATQRQILSGREKGRELSYLGKVMEAAGLQPTNAWRRSVIVKSHGNPHRVFVLRESREGAA